MSTNKSRAGYFLLGTTLGLALIISSLLFTDTIKYIKSENRTVSVKGYAEKHIVSDLAKWSMSISATAETRQPAYSNIERDVKAVRNYLIENGIDDDEIGTEPIRTMKYTEKQGNSYQSTGRILAYELTQVLTVETEDVELISKLSGRAGELLKLGVNFEPHQPQYYYTKLNDLKIEMLGLAAKDSHTRAIQLIENSGGKIGRPASARQGVFQITAKNSTDVTDYGIYDLSNIEKTIKAVVTMEYTIE